MKRVEGGMLDERVPVATHDEVGALSRGFNAMLSAAGRRRTREIRAFNRRLADEVKAATLDLARKNEALAQLNRLLARDAAGARRQGAAGGARAARGAAGARDRHAARLGVGPPAAGACRGATCRSRSRSACRWRRASSSACRRSCATTSTRRGTVAPERGRRRRRARHRRGARHLHLGARRARASTCTSEIDAAAARADTDPGLLRQILVNLITNAADALPADGGHIRVEAQPQGGAVAIAVADDGAGIARRGRGAHLRAVLHDQGARQGHRPRPGDLPRAGDGARRAHHRRLGAGPRLDLHRHAAARVERKAA